MNQHDVNTPIEVKQSPALTQHAAAVNPINDPGPSQSALESALAELRNRTSQVIHLSPGQAEAVLMELIRLSEIEALYDGLDSFWGRDDFPE